MFARYFVECISVELASCFLRGQPAVLGFLEDGCISDALLPFGLHHRLSLRGGVNQVSPLSG